MNKHRWTVTRLLGGSLRGFGRVGAALAAVLGPAVGAGPAPVPPQPDTRADIWRDIRSELERADPLAQLSAPVAQILRSVEPMDDPERALWLSYSVARTDELQDLDVWWAQFMTERRDEAGFLRVLEVRAQVLGRLSADAPGEAGGLLPLRREDYLEQWLYQARGGAYECGGNCGNGKGNGGGNGTGNEGNGKRT
ncbi:hypothetical protein [Tropicibacter naphthalenivorans]|uniref:Uncharacterized protein n=1 Tax=Tropicibacter naphthalenivorans TaxID=441103 RepID=A0A0P1GKF5_9RHOB|nr:hypothetical protein [Tropicibacter naphthalenivorans]CUH82682.1 hypothetical protein TRN7648_04225 [Tropicibacter naphthalenivorans]SMD11147.1 hypothetical protein SAMN04488093_1256 [Tropicibacter naphthalenivorans]